MREYRQRSSFVANNHSNLQFLARKELEQSITMLSVHLFHNLKCQRDIMSSEFFRVKRNSADREIVVVQVQL